MARRSLGVVLIVTLLGWTVNQPALGCQRAYSRAAVVVLAGASPAYQPEPSPSRHNCCPHEGEPAASAEPASAARCSSRVSVTRECCRFSGDIDRDLLTAMAKSSPLAKFALPSSLSFESPKPAQLNSLLRPPRALRPSRCGSISVLRL